MANNNYNIYIISKIIYRIIFNTFTVVGMKDNMKYMLYPSDFYNCNVKLSNKLFSFICEFII